MGILNKKDTGGVSIVHNSKNYATIGMVYDYIVEKHQETGRSYAFPKAVDLMRRQGKLLKTMPSVPSFHSGMTQDEFVEFMRGLSISVDPILPAAQTACSLSSSRAGKRPMSASAQASSTILPIFPTKRWRS